MVFFTKSEAAADAAASSEAAEDDAPRQRDASTNADNIMHAIDHLVAIVRKRSPVEITAPLSRFQK